MPRFLFLINGRAAEFSLAQRQRGGEFVVRIVRATDGVLRQRLGLGGLLVTGVSVWISRHGADLPHMGLPLGLGATDPGAWRYLLMTGILPAIPIALLLPFVLLLIGLVLGINLFGDWLRDALNPRLK